MKRVEDESRGPAEMLLGREVSVDGVRLGYVRCFQARSEQGYMPTMTLEVDVTPLGWANWEDFARMASIMEDR